MLHWYAIWDIISAQREHDPCATCDSVVDHWGLKGLNKSSHILGIITRSDSTTKKQESLSNKIKVRFELLIILLKIWIPQAITCTISSYMLKCLFLLCAKCDALSASTRNPDVFFFSYPMLFPGLENISKHFLDFCNTGNSVDVSHKSWLRDQITFHLMRFEFSDKARVDFNQSFFLIIITQLQNTFCNRLDFRFWILFNLLIILGKNK